MGARFSRCKFFIWVNQLILWENQIQGRPWIRVIYLECDINSWNFWSLAYIPEITSAVWFIAMGIQPENHAPDIWKTYPPHCLVVGRRQYVEARTFTSWRPGCSFLARNSCLCQGCNWFLVCRRNRLEEFKGASWSSPARKGFNDVA